MSMIGCFHRIDDADIDAFRANPDRFWTIVGVPKIKHKPGLLSRLFGHGHPPNGAPDDDWQPLPGGKAFDVDKAWHGIHFLLCHDPETGPQPLAFILDGGHDIGDIDPGYGPVRALTATQVADIAEALNHLDLDQLRAQCHREDFAQYDIYPNIWDEPDENCFGYLFEHLSALIDFIDQTRNEDKGLLVWIG